MNTNHAERTGTLLASAAALWLLAGAAAAESDIDLRGGVGYDSNPYDLNSIVGVRDGFFTELDATVEAIGFTTGGWRKRADIGFSGKLYESSLRDADEARLYVRARGNSEERYDQNGWEWSLRYQGRDRTYVNRLTGEVGTDGNGNDIGDRFDNGAADLSAAWRLPGWKLGRLSLEASVLDRNYLDDYEEFGLERLDYTEYALTPGYDFESRANEVRVRLRAAERRYDDRRTNDADGDPVPGTDLVYRYYGVDARYRHRFSRRIMVELSGRYETREDNGVGYGDRTIWSAGAEWNLRLPRDNRLSIEGEYGSRVFDQQVVGDPTVNDEQPEKKGFQGSIRYSRPFPFVDIRGFLLVIEADWESYDNSRDERYTYDRVTGFLGVRKDF
jgi:hypothetical protein